LRVDGVECGTGVDVASMVVSRVNASMGRLRAPGRG